MVNALIISFYIYFKKIVSLCDVEDDRFFNAFSFFSFELFSVCNDDTGYKTNVSKQVSQLAGVLANMKDFFY